jgi:uncharacterized membrane protein
MWIGNSMLFNWLDRNLERREGAGEGHIGDIWMVHSGGFYQVEKKHLAPSEMPATLHWFKWQNGVTWISGIALLILVFYMGDAALLTDPSVSNLQGASAIGVGVGCLVAAWVGYDLIWRSPLRKRPTAGFIASLGVILALSAVLFATLSGRAAYIHVGVMLGTIMTGNVWMVIIPSQRELVNATKEGRAQNPAFGLQAKERSVHNNYFTFPLLFIMLSGHFPQTYDHKLNWLVLLVLAVGSAVIRHAMNIRFTYRAWKVPATVALFVTCAATLFFFAHPNGLPRARRPILSPPTAWVDVAPIFQASCEPCHATLPTNTAFPTAPNGVVLENEHLARRWKDKILQRVVILRNMPLANMTHITDAERDRIGAWIDQGCR